MEFDWSDEEKTYRSNLREMLQRELPPEWWVTPMRHHAKSEDYDEALCRRFVAMLGETGWLTPHWPREYGGLETSPWQHVILNEEMGAVGEARGPAYMNVNWIGPAIMMAGTPDQKNYHLTRIVKGDVFWCQGFSEPNAGSDLWALQTRAVRDGDNYIVNGEKIWTSHTQLADYCFLLVRTDPASTGREGISILLVRTDTPGFNIQPIDNFVEPVGWAQCTFEDMVVPVSDRLGEENGGVEIIRRIFENERQGADRTARADLTLNRLAEWARDRGLFSRPDMLEAFGRANAICHVAYMLTYRVVDERAHGYPAGPYAFLARISAARAERAVADLAFDLMGPESMEYRSIAENIFRDSLVAGLGGGSYEVQLNAIGRQLLNLPRR